MSEVDENVMICFKHEDSLGHNFRQNVHSGRNCLYPSHSNQRRNNTLRNPFPNASGNKKKQSLFLFKTHGILLPFGSLVCKNCSKHCKANLKGFVEDEVRSPMIRRNVLNLDSYVDNSQSIVPSQPSTQDSIYTLPSQEKEKNKKSHLDALIRENKIEVKEKKRLVEDWDSVGLRMQQYVLDYAGAGVASVIKTIVPNEDQVGLVYQKLTENPYYVEKHLDCDIPISTFAKEIINTANHHASSRTALKQYFSTLVGIPGINFEFLNQFNRKPSDGPSDSFFLFDFNYHLWIGAVKLRKRFGYGMPPVIKEKNFKWFKDIELCSEIFDYIVSPLNTQRNSYGVIKIKEDSGQVSTMGRVIRHQSNSDLVKDIQSHLKGLGFPVPSASFLFKFLAYLPAASTKEMKGVNNTQESAMRAFTDLDKIVETYASKCGLVEDERINLKACLSASKTYLKTKYYDHLSSTNEIQSHCVSCLVSDTSQNSKFYVECGRNHDETIKCDKCFRTYDTIDALKKLLEKYKNELLLSEYDAAVIYKRLNDAQDAILQYQAHLVKVFTQETSWHKIIDEYDPEVAFYEGDWGMKILPRRHRGKQSEWFGQNGFSNHIGVFTRIVPDSFEEDGITPKSYRKQPDTYTSIVKDSAKQDALTSAAIIKANIEAYKKNYPQVKKIYLRSDCAGCYKCSKLLQALYSLEIPDLKIMGYIYSAPCDGKSLCDTYAAIVKHHLSKMVRNGVMDITTPRELATAIQAASGVANVVVMLGYFTNKTDDVYFQKVQKITDFNTISFEEDHIKVWKQGYYGEGQEIKLNKIPFPAEYHFEFIGSDKPRRNDEQILLCKKPGETEIIQGEADDFDDNVDEIEGPLDSGGGIYRCPRENCDAEFLQLGRLYNHQASERCYQKTKLRTDSIGNYFQKKYIEMYGINPSEKLTNSEKRYKHISWDEESEHVSLLPSLYEGNYDTKKKLAKGFALLSFCSKNPIHDDVRSFVKEKFEEGEITKRHMSYPSIVTAIEDEKDASGMPRFFPNKWLDVQQVSYLVTKFIKDKNDRSKSAIQNEPTEEEIYVNEAEENYARRRDGIQFALENMDIPKPLSEQSHPLLLNDSTNICAIAKDYLDNPDGDDSFIMHEDFDTIRPILEAIDFQPVGRQKRKAGNAIVKFVKTKCGCIPMRRKKNA